MKVILEQADLQQIQLALKEYSPRSDTELNYTNRLMMAMGCIIEGATMEYRKDTKS